MKLRIPLMLILLLFAATKVGAQGVEQKTSQTITGDSVTVNTVTKDTSTVKKSLFKLIDKPRLKMGIRAGVNMANMTYSHEPIERYSHGRRYTGLMGVFAEMPIGKSPLSLRPEITILSRGDKLNWLDVDYDFQALYVDMRLPFTWNFYPFGERISPYLMVAPQLNIPFSGVITYSAEDMPSIISTPITKADIRNLDFSVMLGFGIDFRIDMDKMPIWVSFEAGYNMGMLNNFAERERYGATDNPSNILNKFFGAELWHGTRKTRGAELVMRVALPIDGEYLQRYRNRRKVLPDTILRLQRDTIFGPNDTIIIETPVPVRERSLTTYQTKDCFTIKELYEMIENGEDITGKRICMFDIKFDFDSYKIRKESERPLNELVQMMQDYPHMTVEVYGHTDSIGTPEYNQKLSENRANAVVEYLSNHGISPSRVKSFGYGLRYPIDTNSTEEGRFRNRRVEFDVITIGLKRKYNE